MTKTACFPGRTAVIAIRSKAKVNGERPPARDATVAFPGKWSRSIFLAYCRREHPGEAVRLLEWHPISPTGGGWEPTLWIANPAAFRDYRTGTPR